MCNDDATAVPSELFSFFIKIRGNRSFAPAFLEKIFCYSFSTFLQIKILKDTKNFEDIIWRAFF